MERAILATEIFGIITLVALLYGTIFETKQKSKKKTMFIRLLVIVLITLVLDMISYLKIDWTNLYVADYILTLLTFIAPICVSMQYIQYIYYHVLTKTEVSYSWFLAGIIYCIFLIVATLVLGLTGHLFTVDGGVYDVRECYNLYLGGYILVFFYLLIIILANLKKTGVHDAVAAMMFVLVPVACVIYNAFYPDRNFSIAAMTVSATVVYITLQGEHENILIANEAQSTSLAVHDELTGLLNRLAYNRDMARLGGDGPIGVIFSDLNGLKYTNDNFGHEAGDALLKDYAEMLLACYRRSDVYRISGDEFVVLLSGMPEATFERKRGELLEKINAYKFPIAATGFAFGIEADAVRLLADAEKNMYADKKIFHEKYTEYSRK